MSKFYTLTVLSANVFSPEEESSIYHTSEV